jgi:hypothetical protein
MLEQRLFEMERGKRALWLARSPTRRATRQSAYRGLPSVFGSPGWSIGSAPEAPPSCLCSTRANPPQGTLKPVRGRPPVPWPDSPPRLPPTSLCASAVACRALNSRALPSRQRPHNPSPSPAPIKGSSTLPARAHRPAGPPLPLSRWARTSAYFHRRSSPQAPSLGPSKASTAICSLAFPLLSPEPEPGRERRRALAAAARRHYLHSRHRPQSASGDSNRTLVLLVHLFGPPFAAGELALPPEGTVVIFQGHMCKPGTYVWWSLT